MQESIDKLANIVYNIHCNDAKMNFSIFFLAKSAKEYDRR